MITTDVYAIYGIGGFAKEILPLVLAQSKKTNTKTKIIFLVDNEYATYSSFLGYDVLSYDDFLELKFTNKFMTVAFSNSKRRAEVIENAKNNGIVNINIKSDFSLILGDVEIGEGSILCPYVTLTSDISIGKGFQANIYSYVAHDCKIGDYVTFAPSVKCNGNVIIGNHVYIGTGAIIKQGKSNKPLVIGDGVNIEAGSYVTKSIPSGKTVFGNPAIELTKENLKRRR